MSSTAHQPQLQKWYHPLFPNVNLFSFSCIWLLYLPFSQLSRIFHNDCFSPLPCSRVLDVDTKPLTEFDLVCSIFQLVCPSTATPSIIHCSPSFFFLLLHHLFFGFSVFFCNLIGPCHLLPWWLDIFLIHRYSLILSGWVSGMAMIVSCKFSLHHSMSLKFNFPSSSFNAIISAQTVFPCQFTDTFCPSLSTKNAFLK